MLNIPDPLRIFGESEMIYVPELKEEIKFEAV